LHFDFCPLARGLFLRSRFILCEPLVRLNPAGEHFGPSVGGVGRDARKRKVLDRKNGQNCVVRAVLVQAITEVVEKRII